jgi:hypothetical protein
VRRPFYAKFDPDATWFDQLIPAFGERSFFFEDYLSTFDSNRSIFDERVKVLVA